MLLTGRSEAPVGNNETPWILGRCGVYPAALKICTDSCPEAAKNAKIGQFVVKREQQSVRISAGCTRHNENSSQCDPKWRKKRENRSICGQKIAAVSEDFCRMHQTQRKLVPKCSKMIIKHHFGTIRNHQTHRKLVPKPPKTRKYVNLWSKGSSSHSGFPIRGKDTVGTNTRQSRLAYPGGVFIAVRRLRTTRKGNFIFIVFQL